MLLGPAAQLSPWGHLPGIMDLTSNSQCKMIPSAIDPESCCSFLAHGVIPLQPARSGGVPGKPGQSPTTEWACTQQELHLCVYIQENLRPKSPSFVPDMRTVLRGRGGRTQASGAGHFIVEASVPESTSSARPGIGQPMAKENWETDSTLIVCLTDFSTRK